MSNMSYCRFRNTVRDLDDCQHALEALFDPHGEYDPEDFAELSQEEQAAAARLVRRCAEIVRLVGEAGGLEIMEGQDDERLEERGFAEKVIADANEAAKRFGAGDEPGPRA